MFRITEDPSSGSLVQCLAKNYNNNKNIFIYCNWVVTRWQWLFYTYTKHEIGYY